MSSNTSSLGSGGFGMRSKPTRSSADSTRIGNASSDMLDGSLLGGTDGLEVALRSSELSERLWTQQTHTVRHR